MTMTSSAAHTITTGSRDGGRGDDDRRDVGTTAGGSRGRVLAGFPPPPEQARAQVADGPVADPGGEPVLVWAVSAHGGAGATSLAARVGFIGDAGGRFPSGAYPGEDRVVICAAETVAGLEAAQNLALQHLNGLGGETRLLAVVTHPVHPGWTGAKTPVEIRGMLDLLDDPGVPWRLIRLGFDSELALTAPDQVQQVTPGEVAEWMRMDAKARRRATRSRDSLAASGVVAAAADLVGLAADPPDPSPD
ncbi:hypothetical protein [Corynebacterium bovis]|uniref:hypothetical protein n=1 Tax=Corynebacterium bovis TaxID=36808 RepID=UPI000F637060|nr:hypothetical protein [Corynebacterium bovis]